MPHVNYLWDDATRPRFAGRSARLPLEPARRRPAHHQHRRRQHLVEARPKRPAHRRAGRGAVGQGLGRRPAHEQARELLLAVPGQAARPADSVYAAHAPSAAPKTPAEDAHGRPVPALHLQPQPARVVDRHAAARLRPGRARRSHAPERGHRVAAVEQLRAADAGDLRRRRGLDAVAAPRLRARPRAAGDRRASIRTRGAS